MTVLITFTTVGTDAGPFNLYSDANAFCCAFEVGITSAQLLAGFPSNNVPDGTTIIKATSTGLCSNSYDMPVNSATCFNFLPDDSYLLSTVRNINNTYVYGAFDGYEESGVATNSNHLIKLNLDKTIDPSFDVNVGFDEILYTGSSIIQQLDGKIIVTGTFTTYHGVSANRIIRLSTDGSRDPSFVIGTGFDGFTQVPALDNSQRVIVTGIFGNYNGSPAPRIARLLPNGTLDSTFVTGIGFNSTTLSVIINPDDSMIISGYFSTYKGVACGNGLCKLNSVGTIDPSFVVASGFSPYLPDNATYLARIPGETSIYAGGYFTSYKGNPEPYMVKIDSVGNKDVSFNAGTGFDDIVYDISVIWGNKLFVSGYFTSYNGVTAIGFILLNPDGSILYAPPVQYDTPIVLGDSLVGKPVGGCLETIYTLPPVTTSSSTTPIPITTSSSTTVLGNANTNGGLFFDTWGEACAASPVETIYTNGGYFYYDAAMTIPVESNSKLLLYNDGAYKSSTDGVITSYTPCS